MTRFHGIWIDVKPLRGTSINNACSHVKELSEYLQQDLSFKFNGVEITTKNQSINDMIKSYNLHRS